MTLRSRLFAIAAAVLGVLLLFTGLLIGALNSTAPSGRLSSLGPHRAVLTAIDVRAHPSCRWLARDLDAHLSPADLAAQVVARMTLPEKIGEMVLFRKGEYENATAGVPRLCIPALTLEDGPQGLAFAGIPTTQLPSPLGLAATFNASTARQYGVVLGSDASDKGIDVIQSPDLNLDRIPENGRGYEGFGEDPVLASTMGVAEIEGIQSQGVMAQAKHFAVYNQETDRGVLDDAVDQRSVEELYLPPFRNAVTQAHVASVMCAYPELNGTYQCESPALLALLRTWGFTGFVRSDLGAIHDPVAAITAGVDLLKPEALVPMENLVRQHEVPITTIDTAVAHVLTAMFAYHLIGPPSGGNLNGALDDHGSFPLQVAEQSAVLLKNASRLLPLDPHHLSSLAVIGADAQSDPSASGFGSAYVVPPYVTRPLTALVGRLHRHTHVTFVDGGSTTGFLPVIPSSAFSSTPSGTRGLVATLREADGIDPAGTTTPDEDAESGTAADDDAGSGVGGPTVLRLTVPTPDITIAPHPGGGPLLPNQTSQLVPGGAPTLWTNAIINPNIPTAHDRRSTPIELPAGWPNTDVTLTGTLTPPHSGLYDLSLTGSGAATVTFDGEPVVTDDLSHVSGLWSQTAELVAGRHYAVHIDWTPVSSPTATGELTATPSTVRLGWRWVQPLLAQAASAARRASVAVVLAGDFSSEGFDRPSLALPGDEDALISAVAAANPRTVVVLNTGGPVLMPWIHAVAAVMEDWYPGQDDGTAITDLLLGDADPSGRLPVTFPTSETASAITTAAQWPGVDLVSTYSEGLEIGYRYNHATGTSPLFPFGFGLDYTTISLHRLLVRSTARGVDVTVTATNTGGRAGAAVPEVYLTFPASAGEPPAQLVAFRSVTLAPGRSQTVTMLVARHQFAIWTPSGWTTPAGTFTIGVGPSSSSQPLRAKVTLP